MGKKKKKSTTPQKPPSNSTPTTPESALPLDVLDWKTVSLIPPKSTSLKVTDSKVVLSESDSKELDILDDEQVIVISQDDPVRAFIGRAVISRASQSPAKDGRRPMPKGSIQITSLSQWSILVPDSIIKEEEEEKEDAPIQTPKSAARPPTTPSTPSTPFSFRSGGGGDQLYTPSPSSNRGTPTTGRNQMKKQSAVDVWIVALDSDLGRNISNRLCALAKTVKVRHVPKDNKDLLPANISESVLDQIIRAFLVNQYCQAHQHLTVTIFGKYTTFEVIAIEESDVLNVEERFEKLSLEDYEDDEKADILEAVLDSKARLCLVASSTSICLQCVDSNSAKEESKENEDSTSMQYVVGLENELTAALDVLKAPILRSELFASRSVRPPRGVLLHGPSGVGKSSLARQIAKEMEPICETTFISCTELQTKLAVVGEAERELSRYFRTSLNKAKLLIFDDIHLICPQRGSHSAPPGVDQLASTLLSLLDGVSSATTSFSTGDRVPAPLTILAITPNPSSLDPALRRPGRLDTEIEVPLPDEPASRAAILKFHCARMGESGVILSKDEWLALGKLAKGFSGSDCMLAIKEANRAVTLRRLGAPSEVTQVLTYDDLMLGIRQTKPSSTKSVTVEIPQVKWSEIGGMEDVKRELREAIEQPLQRSDLYAKLRLPSPRGILLYGPPGCSKTLTARALATEGQMNFLAVKGPELLSKWLGESERALASLFRRARMASPSIIFFDEMDAIAAKRGSGDSASSSRLLSQLLTELDGVSVGGTKKTGKTPRVVVVGATNRPDLLDTALTRPGRMDRMIYVGPPDYASRERIFEIGLKGRPREDSVNIALLAQQSDGFSGAEVIAICRDAALMALEEHDQVQTASYVISQTHLERAIAGMNRQITPEMIAFYDKYRNHRT